MERNTQKDERKALATALSGRIASLEQRLASAEAAHTSHSADSDDMEGSADGSSRASDDRLVQNGFGSKQDSNMPTHQMSRTTNFCYPSHRRPAQPERTTRIKGGQQTISLGGGLIDLILNIVRLHFLLHTYLYLPPC